MQTAISHPRDSQIGALYTDHYEYLVGLSIRKYEVPREEAETLVHDVFVNMMRSSDEVERPLAYLTIGVLRASAEYWRKRRREETDEDPTRGDRRPHNASESALVRKLTVNAAVRLLRERCQETLSLYFVEGCTAKEVARKVGTSRRYAEKLIRNCLGKLRGLYGNIKD